MFACKKVSIHFNCCFNGLYFCLMGYWINHKQSDREPQEDDKEMFEQLAKPFFTQINWYSFKPQDAQNGGCCSYQVNLYVEYGQKYGLSPVEYHKKIFYFAQTGYEETSLVFLKTTWSTILCMNVISQLGFGRGSLKIVGSKRMSKPFVVPPLGTNRTMVHVFGGSKVGKDLNFAWFMYHVLCKSKPDLCPDMEMEIVGTSRSAKIDLHQRKRHLISTLFANNSYIRI
ncbi:uncharacterized protein LOC142357491 isoform X2 [Convolutriloba macropyga]|uniref:uncharacterized protein LOC142357491 isoform X2 n=1 Tax=Convolutriloba macropyga TaxID=536237 RepID=UPI003F51CCB8